MAIKRIKIDELIPDEGNANRGTQRGLGLLDDSLRELGAGRSIVLDAKNRIIAGNKTTERAEDLGLEDVIVIETDGNQLVAVKRVDLDLDNGDGRARRLAYYDNRVGELDLDWDVEQLAADLDAGLNLSGLWSELEFEVAMAHLPSDDEWASAFGNLPEGDRAPFQQMTFTLHDEQVEVVKEAMSASKAMGPFDGPNENSNGNALARVCEVFLGQS